MSEIGGNKCWCCDKPIKEVPHLVHILPDGVRNEDLAEEILGSERRPDEVFLFITDGRAFVRVIEFPVHAGSPVEGETMWVEIQPDPGDAIDVLLRSGSGRVANSPAFSTVPIGSVVDYAERTEHEKPRFVRTVSMESVQ